jgi:hypothetical protein
MSKVLDRGPVIPQKKRLASKYVKDVTIIPPTRPRRGSPNGKVDPLILSGGDTATWRCPGHEIVIMFPSCSTPLSGGRSEVTGFGVASATIDSGKKGHYSYCILIRRRRGRISRDFRYELVEGNSPPDMDIQ